MWYFVAVIVYPLLWSEELFHALGIGLNNPANSFLAEILLAFAVRALLAGAIRRYFAKARSQFSTVKAIMAQSRELPKTTEREKQELQHWIMTQYKERHVTPFYPGRGMLFIALQLVVPLLMQEAGSTPGGHGDASLAIARTNLLNPNSTLQLPAAALFVLGAFLNRVLSIKLRKDGSLLEALFFGVLGLEALYFMCKAAGVSFDRGVVVYIAISIYVAVGHLTILRSKTRPNAPPPKQRSTREVRPVAQKMPSAAAVSLSRAVEYREEVIEQDAVRATIKAAAYAKRSYWLQIVTAIVSTYLAIAAGKNLPPF